MLEGMTVCGGVAVGPVRLRGYELDRPTIRRIPTTQLDSEVARFHAALERSKQQVATLRHKLARDLGALETRILEVHSAYLHDSQFLGDVENRIRGEQLSLEDALAQAVRDFDRIFELVESERMKERALDMRDVALRVIRNLSADGVAGERPGRSSPHILAAHKLSIADLFDLDCDKVLGIVAEEGGLDSHAGIVARSLGIPTVTGLPSLRESFGDGDYLIVDAGTGVVYVNPGEELRQQYEVRVGEARAQTVFEDAGPIVLADGVRVGVFGSCGNLGEVSQAMDAGLDGVGVYRTELLFLVDPSVAPGEDLLAHHYGQVLARAGDRPVTFRLLDLARDQRVAGLPRRREANPALGNKGIRLLLDEPALLRTQLRALLRVAPDAELRVAVPFVTTTQDLSRVREALRNQRAALTKEGIPCADRVLLGAVVEVPATAFHVASVATGADFLIISLDSLQQYLLAADRDSPHVGQFFDACHPALFRLLATLAREAAESQCTVTLFGESASDAKRIPFYLGVGYRSLSVSPFHSRGVREALATWNLAQCQTLAQNVLEAATSLEVQRILLEAERQSGA